MIKRGKCTCHFSETLSNNSGRWASWDKSKKLVIRERWLQFETEKGNVSIVRSFEVKYCPACGKKLPEET